MTDRPDDRQAAEARAGIALLDIVPDPVIVVDAACRVLRWNAAMEALSGVRRAGALGRPVADLLPFLRDPPFAGALDRALAGESATTGETAYRFRGREGWTEARYVPWRDAAGRVAGVVGLHADVGDRRRRGAADALARLARELTGELDIERVAAGVVRGVVDLLAVRGATVYRVEGDGRLRALASGGVDVAPGQDLVIDPGEGIAGRALAEQRAVVTRDIFVEPGVVLSPALRQRLARHDLRAAASVPLRARGQVVGALTVGDGPGREFDADDLQALQAFADQAALALENARLYASARENLTRLRDAQVQLVQAAKMSALGRLVSGVAHELNNPLSVIIGYGQLLLAREVPAPMRRPLELMVSQGDRMAKIVRNLLYFARQRPPEHGLVDVRRLLERTLALRQTQLQLNGIRVEREYAEELPAVEGDAQQLDQVFLNLILNAEQAILDRAAAGGAPGRPGAPKPGGRILLRARPRADGRAVLAEVVDDGPGVAPEHLARIFEPFFTTRTIGMGSGLGLSVSYGIVHEHGGRLGVESRPGHTVFTVELPVATPAGPAEPEPTPASVLPLPGEGRLALVVEDDAPVVDLVVTLLGTLGWRVDVAPGGRAGLERVRRAHYDLIVSDLRMPDGNGQEFYREALAHDPALAERFLFMTGDTANREAWEFLRSTAVPVVEKPFQPALFLATVRTLTRSG